MQVITSIQNSKIQQVRKLHDHKARTKQRLFLAEGLRTIETLLLPNNLLLTQIFITPEVWDNCSEKFKNLPENLITLVSNNISQKISTTSTTSGILAVFKTPPRPLENLSAGIVCVDLNNPGNLGTLIRTAAALNLNTIVTIAGTDPWGPKVIQASAGTIGKLKIYELSWPELLNFKQDLKLCALAPNAKLNLLAPENIKIIKNNLLIIGNEAHGIPKNYLETCDYQFSLPMPGHTESLNAAIAGAIAMYLSTQ